MNDPRDIVAFWHAAGPKKWFRGGPGFDLQCETLFADLHIEAASRKLDAWMDTAEGALALVLLLDQIPRNIFRGTAHAFATDPLALALASRAIDAGFDKQVDPMLRIFFYLPFEHSEAMADQDRCCALFKTLGNADLLHWAELHADIIRRFGRFPHRNHVLGRETTADEQVYLDAGGGFT